MVDRNRRSSWLGLCNGHIREKLGLCFIVEDLEALYGSQADACGSPAVAVTLAVLLAFSISPFVSYELQAM